MSALGYLDVPLFSGLSRVDVARLVPQLEEVVAGEVVMRQGEPGDALYVVREWRVCAELAAADRTTVIGTFGPGNSARIRCPQAAQRRTAIWYSVTRTARGSSSTI